MIKPLCLSPFPTRRADDESPLPLMQREGFMDEAVVATLVRESQLGRSVAYSDDLALAADDLDFAGWSFAKSVQPRSAEVPPQVIDAIVRRASPQVSSVQRSNPRRQWLMGLAVLLLTAAPEALLKTLLFSGEFTTSKAVLSAGDD